MLKESTVHVRMKRSGRIIGRMVSAEGVFNQQVISDCMVFNYERDEYGLNGRMAKPSKLTIWLCDYFRGKSDGTE